MLFKLYEAITSCAYVLPKSLQSAHLLSSCSKYVHKLELLRVISRNASTLLVLFWETPCGSDSFYLTENFRDWEGHDSSVTRRSNGAQQRNGTPLWEHTVRPVTAGTLRHNSMSL